MQMILDAMNYPPIQAQRRQEKKQEYALVFVNSGKSFKVREDKRANSGTVIMGHHDVKLGLGIVLTREGSVLSFVLYNLRTAQTLKQLRSRIENNYANYHHIFRVSSDEKLLLCYHESRTDIEVRRLNTLKQRGSLDLIQICKKFNLLERFNQIRFSLDFDSITHLGKIVVMLASKLILVKKEALDQAEVLFDCADSNAKEILMGVRYNSEQRVLLVTGMKSFFVFGFNSTGLSCSRAIFCNQFGRSIRLLGWDPKEEIILIAQRIMGNKENYHLIDYHASDPVFVEFLRGQSLMGTYYDSKNHRLFFIETRADQRKDVRIVSFKDFREVFGLDEQ